MTQHRRNKSSAPDLILDKVAGSFTDWGVRRYFSRVFSRDYSLLKDIELAGYKADLDRITKETMGRNTHVELLGDDSSAQQKHNSLAKRLNDVATDANPTELTWNALKSDFLKHMDTGLRIYRDFGKSSNSLNKPGYFLNTNDNKLFYMDKDGSQREVICFDDTSRRDLEKLFPKLFQVDRVMTGQKSMKLTSARFMQMVELAVKKDSSVKFHQELGKNFVSLFRKLEQRMYLKKEQDLCKDSRSARQLYIDIIKRMQGNITEYLKVTGLTSKQKAILEGMQKFITDPRYSVDELRTVVEANDRGWLRRWFLPSSSVDRDLDSLWATIKQMQTSGSAFLTAAVQAVQTPEAEGEDLEEAQEQVFTEGLRDSKSIHDYWQRFRVPKTAFDAALVEMLGALDVHAYVEEGQGIGLVLDEGQITVNLPKIGEKTVFDEIKEVIETCQRADTVRGQTYESATAALHQQIADILNRYNLPDKERVLVDETIVSVYQLAERKLIEGILGKMEKNPKIVPKAMITVSQVREQINAVLSTYDGLIEELNSCRSKMSEFDQTSFANDLNACVATLMEKKAELTEQLRLIAECDEKRFDILAPASAGQEKVKAALDLLVGIRETGGVIAVIDEKITQPNGDNVPQRKFIATLRNADKTRDYANAYDAVTAMLGKYAGIEAKLNENIAQLQVPNTDLVSVARGGMFAPPKSPEHGGHGDQAPVLGAGGGSGGV